MEETQSLLYSDKFIHETLHFTLILIQYWSDFCCYLSIYKIVKFCQNHWYNHLLLFRFFKFVVVLSNFIISCLMCLQKAEEESHVEYVSFSMKRWFLIFSRIFESFPPVCFENNQEIPADKQQDHSDRFEVWN